MDENEKGLIEDSHPPIVNMGSGVDLTISELVAVVCEIVGFRGRIDWDHSKPDGTPQKLLDISRLSLLGWKSTTNLHKGIRVTYGDFLTQLHEESE